MTRLAMAFWAISSIDAVLLVAFLAMTLQDPAGSHDGGRAMGIFFFILVPAVVLGLAMLLFQFSTSWQAKSIALFIVLVPGLYFAREQVEDRLIDRRVAANRAGTGYFDSEPMRQMGAAVVRRDLDALRRIGPTVDVNTAGRDMTLLRLAVDNADARMSDGTELPVVRTLLALGARPDAAMEAACHRSDSLLLQTLLDAGGNPNMQLPRGEPLVFGTMSSITAANFRLLAARGLNLDERSHGDPLPVQLAIYRRWDLLAIAIELGANTTAARPDGRTVASELASQVAEEEQAGRQPPASLLDAHARLQAHRTP